MNWKSKKRHNSEVEKVKFYRFEFWQRQKHFSFTITCNFLSFLQVEPAFEFFLLISFSFFLFPVFSVILFAMLVDFERSQKKKWKATKIIGDSCVRVKFIIFSVEINHFSLSFITLKFIIVPFNNLFRFFRSLSRKFNFLKLIFSRADEMKNYQTFPGSMFNLSIPRVPERH